MKKFFILLCILALSIPLIAQKSGLKMQFFKIDSEMNAMGLSTVSVQVTNMGDSTEEFGGNPSLFSFYAKKSNADAWKRFTETGITVENAGSGEFKELLPKETVIVEDIYLNIMQLICNYSNEMRNLISTPQAIYVKVATNSIYGEIYSDSVKVEISPLSQEDKIAFSSIKEVARVTDGLLFLSVDESNIIVKEFPTSTFASLARICMVKRQYSIIRTPEMHAQAKQYLSEVRHTEFEYIRYLVREMEAQLAEIEKKGF